MVDTLLYQAEARSADLLWDPVTTARRVLEVVGEVRPGPDHRRPPGVQRPARAAGRAGSRTPTSCSGIPVRCPSATRSTATRRPGRRPSRPDPRRWPPCMQRCRQVRDDFTDAMERGTGSSCPAGNSVGRCVHRARGSGAAELSGAAARPGADRVAAAACLPGLGGAVQQLAAADIAGWLRRRPVDTAGLRQFRQLPVRPRRRAGPGGRPRCERCRCGWRWPSVPPTRPWSATCPSTGWSASSCRRSRCWSRPRSAVTHGGNNSVTESLTCGVPMLVLPFSTDQFAGAAAVEDAGVGVCWIRTRHWRSRHSGRRDRRTCSRVQRARAAGGS